jgi:hypothetical protein
MLVSAVCTSCGYWLIGEGRLFGTGSMPAVVALTALVGFFGIAGAVLRCRWPTRPSTKRPSAAGATAPSSASTRSASRCRWHRGPDCRRARTCSRVWCRTGRAVVITVERLAMITSLLPAALLATAGLVILATTWPRTAVPPGPRRRLPTCPPACAHSTTRPREMKHVVCVTGGSGIGQALSSWPTATGQGALPREDGGRCLGCSRVHRDPGRSVERGGTGRTGDGCRVRLPLCGADPGPLPGSAR